MVPRRAGSAVPCCGQDVSCTSIYWPPNRVAFQLLSFLESCTVGVSDHPLLWQHQTGTWQNWGGSTRSLPKVESNLGLHFKQMVNQTGTKSHFTWRCMLPVLSHVQLPRVERACTRVTICWPILGCLLNVHGPGVACLKTPKHQFQPMRKPTLIASMKEVARKEKGLHILLLTLMDGNDGEETILIPPRVWLVRKHIPYIGTRRSTSREMETETGIVGEAE